MQRVTYTARRVVPDETLIPELEKNGISYGGISKRIFYLIFFWMGFTNIFIFAIWMFWLKECKNLWVVEVVESLELVHLKK